MNNAIESASLAVSGSLTIHTATAQHALLRDALASGADTLDLGGVTEFDTAGVQLLLAAVAQVHAHGRALALNNASAPVRDILARYGLEALCADTATGERS